MDCIVLVICKVVTFDMDISYKNNNFSFPCAYAKKIGKKEIRQFYIQEGINSFGLKCST